MRRRFALEQPDNFAFTPENLEWAHGQIAKYPQGRQASAIIPILWRAQEQEGWLSRPAVEYVAEMLGLAHVRAYEVATFYFMFHLHPVGSVVHFQVCGTTTCMICGAEGLIAVCQRKIAQQPLTVSECGKFSWEEVECLGACANAPVVQVGKDYYEDLSQDRFENIIDEFAKGGIPVPGSQTGRYSSEPASGLTSLKIDKKHRPEYSPAVVRALEMGDTIS